MALGILSAVTVVLVATPLVTGISALWALTIAVPIALAVWYLYGYHRADPRTSSAKAAPEESFDDPVEAADRAATEAAAARTQEEEDDLERLTDSPADLHDDDEAAA